MFEITYTKPGFGKITIDDFSESFESDHSYWSEAQYEEHWDKARQRVSNGHPAFFFTSVSNPISANFFRAWVCYPIGNELVFHEQILFLDQLDSEIDPDEPHIHVMPYTNISEEGDSISEWRTNV